MRIRSFVCLLCVFCTVCSLTAQWQVVPQSSFGYAWGGIRTLSGQPVRAGAVVGRTIVAVRYTRGRWGAEIGAGGKWLLPRGKFGDRPFRGRAVRAILPAGIHYRMKSDQSIALGYEVQNERDFDRPDRRRGDALRHSAWLRYTYPYQRWTLGLTLHRALTNTDPAFFLADPQWAAAVVVAYQIRGADE